MVTDYKDLDLWQKGIEIVDKIYDLTGQFPEQEVYGLARQMQRAAVSIPSNIAEGFQRNSTKEYKQYLRIALGSCGELDTQLVISNRRNYIKDTDFEVIQDALDHECRMIMNILYPDSGTIAGSDIRQSGINGRPGSRGCFFRERFGHANRFR